MTIREAVLKSMEELKDPCTPNDILQHISKKKYYSTANVGDIIETPGKFIRSGDTRVKQIKKGGRFYYYLTKNEESIDFDNFEKNGNQSLKKQPAKAEPAKNELATDIESSKKQQSEPPKEQPKIEIEPAKKPVTDKIDFVEQKEEQQKIQQKAKNEEKIKERDLHILLSSYLKDSGIYPKTIFHEKSFHEKDGHQVWMHPDMVGIRFLKLQNTVNQKFLKTINRMDTFKLYSYELKVKVNGDSELKEAFFQAVSNSSWANYGYLVALEINNKKEFRDEMERLSQSFGIGVIELKSQPFQSKVVFPAKYRELDFKTMDKLCRINKEFEKFIEQAENLMTIDERNYIAVEKEFGEFCDKYLVNDSDIRKYCLEKKIPVEDEE
ncbi:MAG: hypothetical protein LBI15_01755 [Dysgonamonadaceae bacterium]|jgi:hypothetical protein|nr:hypothetical protein [Dysgonamonadaceae bacterium]